jgi:hypothetical protein
MSWRHRARQSRPPGADGGDNGVFSAGTDDFSLMETRLSPGFCWNSSQPACPCRRWIRRWRPSGNQSQDFGEQHFRDSHPSHLDNNMAAMADDLGANLDERLLEAGQ